MINRRALLTGALALPLIPNPLFAAQTGDSALSAVLKLLPASSISTGEQVQLFAYTDMSRYLETEDVTSWSELLGPDGGDVQELNRIPVDDLLHQHIEVDWPQLLGFGPDDVDQVANAFTPPDQVHLYRGTFDLAHIDAALAVLNYASTENDDFIVYSSPNSETIDLTDPVQRVALGALNYIAVSSDLIVCARTEESLESVTVAANSMYDRLADTHLLEILEPMTGFFVFDGNAISAESLGLAPVADDEELPPAAYFAAGVEITESGTITQYLVDFGDEPIDDAVEIIRDRIENGISLRTSQALGEVIGEVTVEQVPDSSVVAISGTATEFAQRWQSMIFSNDLVFIATR